MASNEHRLVSKIVQEGNLYPVMDRGVDASWFVDPDARTVFSFITKHFGQYNQTPSGITVKQNYPNFPLVSVQDSLDFLLDAAAEERMRRAVYAMVEEAVTDISNDKYTDAVFGLRHGLASLDAGSPTSSGVDLMEDPHARIAEYYARSNAGGIIGLPTGFPTIDAATGGLQGGQLVTVVASPKSGKSTLMMAVAIHIHAAGQTTLLQSFEMSNSEQWERHDSIRAGVSHSRLRSNTLDPVEKAKLDDMANKTKGLHKFLLEDAMEGLTISALAAKIGRHNPDVVLVDGVYLMRDEVTGEAGTPQALTNITRAMKRLAQVTDKPIVISTQTLLWKMKGNKTSASSIGYSSSFFQDSDVILGLDKEDGVDDRRTLKVVASRNSGTTEVELEWDWDHGRFLELTLVNNASTVIDPNFPYKQSII